MSKCKICDSDYYLGDLIDPEEMCWCGENCYKITEFSQKIKRIRFKIASIILRCCEYTVDKLTQREI